MQFTVFTPPSGEVVTLDEAKAQCRVVDTAEDGLIAGYILAARQYCESICGSAFMTQTLDAVFDGFGPLTLPRYPVQSITSVTYLDTNSVSQTLDAENYFLTSSLRPMHLITAYGQSWPDTYRQPGAVTVRFVAGYGSKPSDTPEPIRQAILMLVGHWFENRESVTSGALSEAPLSTSALLAPYRIYY